MSDSTLVSDTGRPKPPNAGKGRQKGVPNKTTVAVKHALNLAFDTIGGAEALAEWARSEPTEFYKLWVKMLPAETKLTGDPDNPIAVTEIKRVVVDPKFVK